MTVTCLVAVISLPAGCFNPYSGVKTSILILDKSLAKQAQTIAFFKVENDGFGLGAQRRAIEKNDLPQVQAELSAYWALMQDELGDDEIQCDDGFRKESQLIAHLAGGDFSHAALYLGGSMIWESDGGIIGTKHMPFVGYSESDGRKVSLAAIPGAPEHCMVYRHDGMAGIPQQKFMEVFATEARIYYGLNYSQLSRLLPMAKLPGPLKRCLLWVTRRIDRNAARSEVPGAFCSELVARFYGRLGLELFASGKSPGDVTPVDLAHSNLKPQTSIVLASASITVTPDPDGDILSWDAVHQMDPKTGKQVNVVAKVLNNNLLTHREAEQVIHAFDVLEASLKVIFYERMGSHMEDFNNMGEAIVQHLKRCAALDDAGVTRRGLKLVERYANLQPDVSKFIPYETHDGEHYQGTMRRMWGLRLSLSRCETLLLDSIWRRVGLRAGWKGMAKRCQSKRWRLKNIRHFRKIHQRLWPLVKGKS